MFEIDWQALFGIQSSLAELIVRGTAMYWFLFCMFRFVLRRDVGAVGVADVLLIVVIADASQNAMSGDYGTVTEGMVLAGTLVFWNVVTNWAGWRWRGFERFAEAPPLLLIRDGRMLEGNMKREWLTPEELMAKLRQQGIERPEEVRWAYMESDGQISVRKYSDDGGARRTGARGAGASTRGTGEP